MPVLLLSCPPLGFCPRLLSIRSNSGVHSDNSASCAKFQGFVQLWNWTHALRKFIGDGLLLSMRLRKICCDILRLLILCLATNSPVSAFCLENYTKISKLYGWGNDPNSRAVSPLRLSDQSPVKLHRTKPGFHRSPDHHHLPNQSSSSRK